MIGMFDSGIGGLTTLRALLRQRPDVGFVYLGDTARMPYGNKSPDTVIRYAQEDADFLLSQGATCLVVACNSIGALAIESLRIAHPSIPMFEVITSSVEEAVAVAKKRIGVIGTRATITSGAYEHALKKKGVEEIISQACPLFVPLVEEGWLDESETKRIVRHYLSPLRQAQVEALILGCTHYPLLAPIIERYMGNKVKIVDSGAAVIHSLLKTKSLELQAGEQKYFLTDVSPHTENIAKKWLGREIRFERARLG